MLFPESQRVLYNKNPIEQVICQLRFPTTLRIDAESPVDFQERVRREYPHFQTRVELFTVHVDALPPVVNEAISKKNSTNIYDFSSADKSWTVSLSQDFLALSTKKYERWEDFQAHLKLPTIALGDIYAPVFLTRIGLRYQNVIRRSKLGLSDSSWSTLLNPHLVGLLAADSIGTQVVEIGHQVVLSLENFDSKVRVQHGLVMDENHEACYLLDCDFFTEKQAELTDANEILNYFNRQNRLLFRWAIAEGLHEAMDPQPL